MPKDVLPHIVDGSHVSPPNIADLGERAKITIRTSKALQHRRCSCQPSLYPEVALVEKTTGINKHDSVARARCFDLRPDGLPESCLV